MTLPHAVVLLLVALLGGALNSVAGGGSFFVFPTLLFTGVAPVSANATTTVALWPGTVASVGAYRTRLGARGRMLLLAGTSVLGGGVGAVLLLHTPQAAFQRLIPYLLLLATLVFTLSPHITRWVRSRTGSTAGPSWRALAAIVVAQLVIATYGGFFGAGIGILMLATLGLMGMENIHDMNALKTVLASCVNGVAVLTFIIAGAVAWPQALVMIAGAIAGGFGGAYYARQLDPLLVRRFVILVGTAMTLYFFVSYR